MLTKALIFSAPSGSGKTTIVRHLLAQNPNLAFSISATTRLPRGEEQDGKDYYFLTANDFEKRIKSGDFLEWEEVYSGHKYGTLHAEVDRIWQDDKVVVFDVDVVGGANLKKKMEENALAVFIRVPTLEVLAQRLRARGTESEEALEKRFQKTREELTYEKYFDVTLVNDDLPRALEEAQSLINDFIQS